jgi:hypothetical protein
VTPAYWRDLGERVATTYGVSVIGMLAAHGANLLAVSSLRSAALAAIPACVSVVLGLMGAKVGAPGTASLLPAPKGQETASGGH